MIDRAARSTDLDERIRGLLRTAVAATEAPPPVSEVRRSAVMRSGPPAPSRHAARWIAIAAVVLAALVAGAVWSWRVDRPTTPTNRVRDDRRSLDTYLLPTTLPRGWQIVSIQEDAPEVPVSDVSTSDGSARDWLIDDRAGRPVAVLTVYELPRGTARGGVEVPATPEPSVTATVVPTTAAASATGAPDAAGTWSVDDLLGLGVLAWDDSRHNASMVGRGLSEAEARRLRQELEPTDVGYALPDSSAYVIGAEVTLTMQPVPGTVRVILMSDVGVVSSVYLTPRSFQDVSALLDPSLVGAAPLVRVDPATGDIDGRLWRPDGNVHFWSPLQDAASVDPADAALLLGSMAPVTEDEWRAAIAAADARTLQAPLVASADTELGTISVHRLHGMLAVCVVRDEGRRCRALTASAFSTIDESGAPVNVHDSFLVGDAWLVMRSLDAGEAGGPDQFSVGGVRHVVADLSGGQVAILEMPTDADTVTYSVGPPRASPIVEETMTRPVR